MEKSLSTFANEMASSAMILGTVNGPGTTPLIISVGLATSNSLVLIDEVGRGTSPLEGVGISHAIAERLIDMKVRIFTPLFTVDLTESIRHSCSLQRT